MSRRIVHDRLIRAAAGIAVVSALLIYSGCASRQPYPSAWTALDSAQNCEQVAGDYRNTGEDAASVRASLTALLFETHGSIEPSTVRLSFPDHGLHVDITAVDGQTSSHVLPREQFDCRRGALVIKAGARWFGNASPYGIFVVGRRSLTLELHRAGGYLVVKRKLSSTGVIVLVPSKYTDEKWHRFERLED